MKDGSIDFSQIVGFVIVFLVLFLPLLQKVIRNNYLKKHPEIAAKEKEEEEKNHKEYLRNMELDEEEEPAMPQRKIPPLPPQQNSRPYAIYPSNDQEAARTSNNAKRTLPKRTLNGFYFHSDLENRPPISQLESRNFQPGLKSTIAPNILSPDLEIKQAEPKNHDASLSMAGHINHLIRQRKYGREMILMHEILSPPKSLQ